MQMIGTRTSGSASHFKARAAATALLALGTTAFAGRLLAQDTTKTATAKKDSAAVEAPDEKSSVGKSSTYGWLVFNEDFAGERKGMNLSIASELAQLSKNGKEAEITGIRTSGKKIYVRTDNGDIVVTLKPGGNFDTQVFKKK